MVLAWTLTTAHSGSVFPNSGVTQPVTLDRQKKIINFIDPESGKCIFDVDGDNASSRSGESSARQTPQPVSTI